MRSKGPGKVSYTTIRNVLFQMNTGDTHHCRSHHIVVKLEISKHDVFDGLSRDVHDEKGCSEKPGRNADTCGFIIRSNVGRAREQLHALKTHSKKVYENFQWRMKSCWGKPP